MRSRSHQTTAAGFNPGNYQKTHLRGCFLLISPIGLSWYIYRRYWLYPGTTAMRHTRIDYFNRDWLFIIFIIGGVISFNHYLKYLCFVFSFWEVHKLLYILGLLRVAFYLIFLLCYVTFPVFDNGFRFAYKINNRGFG